MLLRPFTTDMLRRYEACAPIHSCTCNVLTGSRHTSSQNVCHAVLWDSTVLIPPPRVEPARTPTPLSSVANSPPASYLQDGEVRS